MSNRIAHSRNSLPGAPRTGLFRRNHTHTRHTARIILTTAVVALLPTVVHGTDAVRTWDVADNNGGATTNNNFYNNLNWDGDVRPTFNGNSDAYLFNGTGAAVVLNINGGLTEYLVKTSRSLRALTRLQEHRISHLETQQRQSEHRRPPE